MKQNKLFKIGKKIIQVLMIIQILLGLIFIVKNFKYMPNYGDSKEFLELAQTMKLDSFRPFIYPLVLNILTKISNFISLNRIPIIYLLQIVINFVSCSILIKTLKTIFKVEFKKREEIIYTLFLLTIPYNLHFNMSIKCDSLSTSFTVLFLCSLIQYTIKEKYIFAIASFLMMYISCNIRSEKLYFLSFILGCMILIEFIKIVYQKNKNKTFKFKKIVILILILVLGFTTTQITKSIFQNDQETTRSQPTVSMYSYERIVGNTLPQIYSYLPEDIKSVISYEDAINSASDRNKYKIPYETLYRLDGNLNRVNQIMKIAVRRNFPNVINNIGSDFIKNIFSPYYLVINQEDWSQNYTRTRMEGEHYLFTDFYIWYFNFVFVLLNLFVVLKTKFKSINCNNWNGILVIGLYVFISAVFFANLTSQNFHIRYVMPSYVMEIGIVMLLINGNKSKEC